MEIRPSQTRWYVVTFLTRQLVLTGTTSDLRAKVGNVSSARGHWIQGD